MKKTMQYGTLIAVSIVALDRLKDGDIVVYSNEYEYSVKYFYDDKENKRYVFRPHSFDRVFADDIYEYDKVDSIQIQGKVVLFIVDLDKILTIKFNISCITNISINICHYNSAMYNN